jgi:RNA polymerase sigma-70 factor (ECF subfamily)
VIPKPAEAFAPQYISARDLDIERRWALLCRVDRKHFIHFFNKYYEPITRFIYRKTYNLDLAEELASQTFFQAFNNLQQFRWKGVSFGAWLFKIARNEIRLHKRQDRKWRTEELADMEHWASPHPTQLAQMVRQESELHLWLCLDELDEISQDIIILYYWEDMTLPQIGVVLDMPLGTVKSRMKRARDKLKRMFNERRQSRAGWTDKGPHLRVISGRK